MKVITPIRSNIDVTEEFYVKIKNKRYDLAMNVYTEEKASKHITINITSEIYKDEDEDEFNVWLDLDICSAEVFAKKLQLLIEERKKFMLKYLNSNG